MRRKAQRNHRKLQTVLQQAAMQRRKVTRRQRVIQHRVAAILPAKEIQQRTTAVRQITINNTASSAGKDTQTVSESTEDTQPTGVQTKYKMYDGVYFDEVIYTWSMDDSQVRPYCEINVSNATDTSFDFTIYDVDGQNRSLKFKTHTAVFTGDGTQAEYNGNGYHLVFTFPDDRGALPDVVCMQVSGLKDMGGCMYVNNTVPGHEFG